MINDNNFKTVRIHTDTYEKLKEIKFFTNQNYIDIITKSIDAYYKELRKNNSLPKG